MNSNNPQAKKYNYPGPAIMVCPLPNNAECRKLYEKLQQLFDGWKGSKTTLAQQHFGAARMAGGPGGMMQGQVQQPNISA
jgi:hypothetical protein